MAHMGSFSASDIKNLQKKLNKIQSDDVQAFIEECAKELVARLLAKVIKRTPVGDYSKEVKVVAKKDSKNHKGWVQGRFMLTISEQEIQNIAPNVLENKVKKFLGECMK